MRFSDKVVLLTGAAGGFGRAAAHRFAAEGASLVLADRDVAGLAALAATLKEPVATLAGDVTDPDHHTSLVGLAQERFGRLDIAINNAGILAPPASLVKTSRDAIDCTLAVDLAAVIHAVQAQLAVMQPAGSGVILNIASAAGLTGAPHLAVYAAAKHGVVGLTRSVAAEAGRFGVRVNALCPSFAATTMLDGMTGAMRGTAQDAQARIVANIPLRRLATAEEVADAMLFLCSHEACFMTGAAVPLDGGLTAI